MKNKISDIISATANYRLNTSAMTFECHVDKDIFALHVTEIFGSKVSWEFGPHDVTNSYEYFEKAVFRDITGRLLRYNTYEAAKKYKQGNVIDWLKLETYNKIDKEFDNVSHEVNWTYAFNKFAELGLLSDKIYSEMRSQYFDFITRYFFRIKVEGSYAQKDYEEYDECIIRFEDGQNLKVKVEKYPGHYFLSEEFLPAIIDKTLEDIEDIIPSFLYRYPGV